MIRLTKTNGTSVALVILAALVSAISISLISTVIAKDQPADKGKNDAQEIKDLDETWSDKFVAKDLQWVTDRLSSNTIQFPPDAPMIKGRDDVTAAWKTMASTPGLEISWNPAEAFVSSSKDMAYSYGTVKIKNPDGTTENGKYVVVWVKENGTWKCAADIFNSDGKAAQ